MDHNGVDFIYELFPPDAWCHQISWRDRGMDRLQ